MSTISADIPESSPIGANPIRFAIYALIAICIVGGLVAAFAFPAIIHRNAQLAEQTNQLKAQLASYISAKAVARMSFDDMSELLKENNDSLMSICSSANIVEQVQRDQGISEAQKKQFMSSVYDLCPNTKGSHLQATDQFVALYLKGVDERLSGDFAQSANFYGQALASPGMNDQLSWKVRALEGHAYALMNEGQLPQASQDMAQALPIAHSLKDGYVFADLTSIKLMCKQGAKPDDVKTALADARQRFDRLIASSQGNDLFYARLDRGSIEQDAELFVTCAYAGVKSQAPTP